MADAEEEIEANRPRLVASDFDAFAEKLLKHNLLLTALELHAELVEAGLEISRLRDFFSNPGNFERQYVTAGSSKDALSSILPRTSSVATIDSLDDYTRYSDDGARDADERVAVLEFELRKAHETIKALRGSLTEATETETPVNEGNKGDSSQNEHISSVDSLRPHEKRALNFLVNEYLLKNGYRMTSVTFSDENADQDFEDWDDVGLNISKPPDLLHLYRDYSHHTVPEVMLVLKAVKEEKANLEAEHAKLLEECKQLQEEIGELRYENHTLNETIGKLESERKEMADMSQQTESGTESFLQNTAIRASTPERITVNNMESTSETEASFHGNEDTNTSQKNESFHESESHSPAGVEASNNSVSGEIVTEQPGTDNRYQMENISENPADVSVESTQEEGEIIPESPMPPSSPEEKDVGRKVVSSRTTSSSFRDKLLAFTHVQLDNRLSNEVCKLSNADENAVLIVARCLPHIVPNVLLNKREELIPVILCSAIHHPEAKERDNLLHMLFNLIKRPDEDQRQMIMSGCAAFAQVVDPTRVEAELLPQWWEQIGHKYVERRLLVAESCGGLAPYLPDDIRSSLVWSMLKQMLSDDRNEAVREAVTKSLALVVAFIENVDKYEQAYELLVDTLFDSSEKVAKTSIEVFLPSLASWSQDLGKLESHLLTSLICNMENTIRDYHQVEELSAESEDIEKVYTTLETIQKRLPRSIQVVTTLIPALFATVLRSGPFAKNPEHVERYNVPVSSERFAAAVSPLTNIETIFGGSQAVAYHVRRFDKHVSEDQFESWESLSWIHYECLPNLCKIVGNIPVTMTESVQQCISLFRALCITCGKPYTSKKIKPFCMDRLNVLTINDERREALLSSASLPVLAAGVLGCFDSEEDMSDLTSLLHNSVIALAEASVPVDGPVIMFQELSSSSRYHQLLIGVLWQIVVNSEAIVRSSAAPLFTVLIKGVDLDLISRQVLPALVTLASDSQMSVRTASIPAFAAIVENVTDKTILEKVYVQFQSFLEDPQYKDQHELQTTMIRTFGKVAPHAEPHFRDEVLLPRLVMMATINNQLQDEDRRREIALELMEAYVSLTCCFISIDVLNEYIIPGLRAVKQDIETLAPDSEETVLVLLKECETKVDQKSFANFPASSKIGQELKSTFMSGFHKLKDAPRPKMADIFKKKDRFDS
ncbi:hypothetical protein ABFA07_008942 [Porites harrisoni]